MLVFRPLLLNWEGIIGTVVAIIQVVVLMWRCEDTELPQDLVA